MATLTVPIGKDSIDTQLLTTPRPVIGDEMEISPGGRLLQRVIQHFGFRASRNQIEATNYWLDNILPKQVEILPVFFGDYMLKFGPTFVLPPTISVRGGLEPLTPAKSLLTDTDYMAEVRTHFTIIKGGKIDDPCAGEVVDQTAQPVHIGNIPCMLKSKICHLAGKSPEELNALGSDRREPGGYYIVGNERLLYYPEKIRVNRFVMGIIPKKGYKYINITADTIKGSVVTTLTAMPIKRVVTNYAVCLTLNNLKQETKSGKKLAQTFNILKIIRIYAQYKEAILGDWAKICQNPYQLEKIILKFIQPSRRSKCKTMLVDTIADAFIGMQTDYNILSSLIQANRQKYINSQKKKKIDDTRPEMSIEDSIIHSIESSLFSHENHNRPMQVIYSACMMTAMLLEFMAGFTKVSDKDDWGLKRLDCSARQCEQLFRGFWKTYSRTLTSKKGGAVTEKKTGKPILSALRAKVTPVLITNEFHTSFTVTWGLGTVNVSSTNPTQLLQQETFDDKISMLSHTFADVDEKVKNQKVRSTQPSQWGIIDPAATSENASIGLNKKMGIVTHVTVSEDPTPISDILKGNIQVPGFEKKQYVTSNPTDNITDTVLLINGRFVYWCDGGLLLRVLIKAKRLGIIPRKTAIIHNKKDRYLIVSCDAGRCVQPLLIVENNVPVITTKQMWDEPNISLLFEKECMEFIDAAEIVKIRVAPTEAFLEKWEAEKNDYFNTIQEYNLIMEEIEGNYDRVKDAAMLLHVLENDKDKYNDYYNAKRAWERARNEYNNIINNPYTHLMIHPQSMFEPTLANMPFLTFTQAPRITYQSQMGKQAIGVYHSAHDQRFDNDAKVLNRPVRPIVGQQLEKELFLERYQRGAMLQVAFLNYEGQTQEDAFILDKRLVEYGVLDIAHYFVITAELSRNETLKKPSPRQGETNEAYRYLTNQGLPMINAYLEPGDFIIGKEFTDPKTGEKRNTSIQMKMGEYGIVDSIYIPPGSTTIVKVKIRRNRSHSIGDKESSRYAQKGTTSEIREHTDMPYDMLTGERPAMLINTHSIPKRMTIGYLIEPLVSMMSLLTGRRYNGSPFEKPDLDEVYRMMKSFGFDAVGYRWMINPKSGLRFKAMIFMGPMFIQILRHLGKEKLQVRAKGVTKLLTNQPPRHSKYGGRRIGEMERTALLSHGASNLVIKILVDMSDAFTTAFCKRCGDFAVVNVDTQITSCKVCEKSAAFARVKIPYVYKVLVQLMMGAMIGIRFEFGEISNRKMEKSPIENDDNPDDPRDEDGENAIGTDDEVADDNEDIPGLVPRDVGHFNAGDVFEAYADEDFLRRSDDEADDYENNGDGGLDGYAEAGYADEGWING